MSVAVVLERRVNRWRRIAFPIEIDIHPGIPPIKARITSGGNQFVLPWKTIVKTPKKHGEITKKASGVSQEAHQPN